MARNDFMEGFLKGLYQSGVGNPEVNEQRRQNDLATTFKQQELNQKASDSGMVPDIHPDTHSVIDKVLGGFKNAIFPGSGGPQLQTAFKPDPNASIYAQDPTGKVSMYNPGQTVPPTAKKLSSKEGEAALRGQYGKDQTQANKTYTPEQYAAIQSGDNAKIQAAFPNGVPSDAISKQNQGEVARSRKDWSQVWKDKLDLQKRQAVYGGQFGKNQLSLNTALGHVATAATAYDSIGNLDEKFLNTPINKLKSETNDPHVVSLGISLNALQGELSNVFKGSGATDQEIGAWQKYLNEDLTPKQYRAAIDQVGELLNSRLEGLQYQQQNIAPDLVNKRPTLSPNAKNTMTRIDKNKSSSGAKPKSVIQNGQTYTLNPLTGQYE